MTAWEQLPDLASRRLGGGAVYANDEFFAAADHLVLDEPSGFAAATFGPKGQVYDGWETRRRREAGHDHAIVRLGAPGIVRGIVIDTAHFTGNYPPYASVDGCSADGYPAPSDLDGWFPLLPRVPLTGDARHLFGVSGVDRRVTHVRLNIFPDGGVARLRVHGEVVPDPRLLPAVIDLAALEHGGQVVSCSDMFYGSPQQLVAPGLARVMGEGWETRRRRDDGNDWVVVRLAAPGRIQLAELDTTHFKGNAPGAARLRGIDSRLSDLDELDTWADVLPRTRLQPDTRHRFRIDQCPVVTHVRLDIFPDGGMARLRLYGEITPDGRAALLDRWRATTPAP
ncbi:allantoicase [Actinomycetes bacterium KLBMP 9797]